MAWKSSLCALLGSCALSVVGAATAAAQVPEQVTEPGDVARQDPSAASDGQPSASADQSDEDIVVTGTLIRGIAPTGTNVVSVSQQDIIASGATTANEILATVPQVTTNFNRVRSLGAGGSGITALSPSIRNLGASGATTTLLLMDGHRIVNAGVISTTPDPDVMPPGIIERVEVVPDGGSSIYGSDAVGGVINFITRKRFDGVEAAGHYGFGDNYSTVDLNMTGGSDWGSGSGYVSYSFLHHDAIFGRDRDFLQQVTDNAGQCGPGTIFVGTTPYALPGRMPGTITECDITDDQTLYPRETRHSIFGGLSQELGEGLEFDIRAYYTRRESIGRSDPEDNGSGGAGVTATVTPATFPGYIPVAGDTGTQIVAFNYAGLIDTRQPNELEVYQITPSVTAQLGSGWQLRALASYGQSSTETFNQIVNPGAQAAAIAAGTLNPYDPSTTSPSVLSGIFRNFVGRGDQDFIDARLVVDGALFSMPGGEVRVAAGAEYLRERIKDVVFGEFVPGTDANAEGIDARRNTKSLFGELVVPLVGSGNAMGGIQSLTLSASGRYDHYSDFGGTFNPKIGLTYEPVEWVKFRGNWGKSFNAPSLSDTHAADTRSFSLPAFLALAPGVPPTGLTQMLVVLVGGNPDLGPQKAKTWSIGTDIEVPGVPGLDLSVTYYNIHLTDQIAFNTVFYTPATEPFFILAPTQAEVEAAVANAQPYLGVPIPLLYTPAFGGGVYSLLDFRRQNLASVKQAGIDFNLRYSTQTSFGSLFAGIAGTHTLHRRTRAAAGGDFIDVLEAPGGSDLALLASVGGTVGNLSATLSWNHTGGYDLDPVVTTNRFGTQSKVDAFNTVDLFVEYDVNGQGLLSDLSFTLNIENLFDEDPPFYSGAAAVGSLSGFTNGSTLGRVILFGARKKF